MGTWLSLCDCSSKLFDEEGKTVRGYRKIMFREYRERGMTESTERVCETRQGQLERMAGYQNLSFVREQDVTEEHKTVESNVGTGGEELNDAESSICDTKGDSSGEHWMIVEQLMVIMVEGRTGDGIMALCLRKWTRRFWRFKRSQ